MRENNPPYVLIDMSWIAHRARFAMDGLEHDDLPTGVLFGFFEQLRKLLTNKFIKSNRAMFFLDSYESVRKKRYSAYKKKRHEDDNEETKDAIRIMYRQVNTLTEDVLPDIGFPVYSQRGLESDDLMAEFALSCTHTKQRAIVITGDKDLLQCISPAVSWYDPSRWLFITQRKFQEKYNIFPYQYGEVKAIAGCSSDEVDGIEGVGEKTAIKFIKGELPKHHKTYQKITSRKGQRIIKRNRKLVVLPHKKTEDLEAPTFNFNISVFYDFCEKYGMELFMADKRLKEWQNIFNGNIGGTQKQVNRIRRRSE